MNTFVVIEKFKTFEKVIFYTVRLEINGEEEHLSETDKFLNQYKNPENDYFEEFAIILNLIKAIGKRGAKDIYFRFENSALALPGKPKMIREVVVFKDSKLRLYCIKLSDEVVVLYNGGVKTENKAQNCPNVSQYFRQANKIAKKLIQSIGDGEIRICGKELMTDGDEIGFYI